MRRSVTPPCTGTSIPSAAALEQRASGSPRRPSSTVATRRVLVEREVGGAIDQYRELVRRASTRTRRGAAPAREHRLEHLQRRVVGAFTAHELIEQRSIERQQRRTLFGAWRVVRVEPIHHEAEL